MVRQEAVGRASCDPRGFEPHLRYPVLLSDLWCILCGTNTSRLEAGSVEGSGGEVSATMPECGATAFGVGKRVGE